MRLSEISRTIDIYNKRLYNENMESMPTVYLDMDGVLADFFGGIEKLYGVQHWKELTSDKTKLIVNKEGKNKNSTPKKTTKITKTLKKSK